MRKFAIREAAGSALSDDVHDDEHADGNGSQENCCRTVWCNLQKGKHIGIFENRNYVLKKEKLNHPKRWGSRNTKRYEVRKVEVLNPDERKSA